MLISYRSHDFSRESFFTNVASDALRLASHSLFAHVGLVGTLIPDARGHRWLHSTLHHDDDRMGVKKTPLNYYLKSNTPCDLLVLRYTGTDTKHLDDMIAYGSNLAKKKV